jgi:hypothetical protein
MALEYFRDAHYRIIGSIETESNGKQIARDARYNRVGDYDPILDQTRDGHYQIIGPGNQLSLLIWRTVK